MNLIPQLWQPILLASVLVFVASSIIWMALPIHKHDYKDPGEKEGPLMDFLRKERFQPGLYYVPWCQGGKSKDPAMADKLKNGPWAILSVAGSAPNMGKMFGAWFAHLLIISFYVAYVLNAAVPAGAPYLHVSFVGAGSGGTKSTPTVTSPPAAPDAT